jgi:hypothetical protein
MISSFRDSCERPSASSSGRRPAARHLGIVTFANVTTKFSGSRPPVSARSRVRKMSSVPRGRAVLVKGLMVPIACGRRIDGPSPFAGGGRDVGVLLRVRAVA